MVGAALDLAVVVEVFFEGSLRRPYRGGVGDVAVRSVQESVPRFGKCERRREKALRENLDGEAAGQLLRLLGCGNLLLHGLPEFLNRERKCALFFGEEELLGIEMPLGEAIWPIVLGVELVDFALQPADHYLLDALLLLIRELAGLRESHRVQNFEQTGEAPRVAVVRRSRQEELVLKQWRDLPERFYELVILAEGRGTGDWPVPSSKSARGPSIVKLRSAARAIA